VDEAEGMNILTKRHEGEVNPNPDSNPNPPPQPQPQPPNRTPTLTLTLTLTIQVNRVMSNSFGFGGTNACLVFDKYTE